jgi:hypothetical protein
MSLLVEFWEEEDFQMGYMKIETFPLSSPTARLPFPIKQVEVGTPLISTVFRTSIVDSIKILNANTLSS